MKYVPMTHEEKMAIDRHNCILSHSQTAVVDATEQAVLARIEQQGLVIVPREPTAEMVSAFSRASNDLTKSHLLSGSYPATWQPIEAGYKAMLEATKEST